MIYSNPNYIVSKCNLSLSVFETLMQGIKVWCQGDPSGTLNGCIIFLQIFYLIKLYVPGFSFCNRLSDCTDAFLKERVQKEILVHGNLGKVAVRSTEDITAAHNVHKSEFSSTSSHADAKSRIKERNILIHMLQKENEVEINNVMSGPSNQATAYDSDFVDSPLKTKRVIYKFVFVGSSSKSKVQKDGKSVASSSKCKIVQKKEKRKSPRTTKLAESKEKAIEVPSCSKEVLKDSTDRNRELLAKSLADRSLKQLKNLRSAYVSKVHNQYLQLKKNASFTFERNESICNVAHFGLFKNKRIENDALAKCGSFKVTRKQVCSLDDQKWVSSAVVDIFAEYINFEELNSANHQRLVCFESAFGSYLMKLVSENEINEEGVKKYAKIFERDFNEELPKTLMAAQLFARFMSKYRNKIDKLEVVDGTEVFQDNGYDCGVLMLKYLLEWKHNAKSFFTKREAFLYRIDLVDKLLRNKHNNYHSEVCHGVLELTGCLDVEELRKNVRE